MAWPLAGKVTKQDVELKKAQKIHREGKKERQQKPNHRRGLQLESPAEGLAGGAQGKQQGGQGQKGEENAEGVGGTFRAGGASVFTGELDEMKGFEGENGKDTRHDVQDQTAEEGKEEDEWKVEAGGGRRF